MACILAGASRAGNRDEAVIARGNYVGDATIHRRQADRIAAMHDHRTIKLALGFSSLFLSSLAFGETNNDAAINPPFIDHRSSDQVLAEPGQWALDLLSYGYRFDEVFDSAGQRQPLGNELNGLNLDATILPFVAIGGAGATLGTTDVQAEFSGLSMEISAAYGISEDISLGATLPLVRYCSDTRAGLSDGNMGPNPAFDPNLPIGLANAPFLPVGFGAAAPAGDAELQDLLTNPAFGLEYKPLASRCREGIGDPSIGALIRLDQSQHSETLLTAALRLGLGMQHDPDDLLDPNLNDASTDLILQIDQRRDLNQDWELYGYLNRTWQLPDESERRVPTAASALATAASKETLDRNLGDTWELHTELAHRWNSWRLAGGLYYFHKAADRYRSPRGQDVSELTNNSKIIDREWTLGLRWDAWKDWQQGKGGLPLSAELKYWRSFSGRNSADLEYLELRLVTAF